MFGTYIEYFIQLPRLTELQEKSIDLYIPFIGHIFPLKNIGVKAVTILLVLLLTMVSYRSTKAGGKLLASITFLKVIAIGLVIIGLLFSGKGNMDYLFQDSTVVDLTGWALVGGIVAAFSGAFWGYDGWNSITFVGGEIKDPQRNIPRSLLIGILVCIAIYVLVNIAYLYVMPIDTIANSSMVASDASTVAFGVIGGGLIALLVLLSTLGTTHGNILATTRISFAMSREGSFFGSLGKVHPQFGTPANAILIHGIWTSVLVLSGSFDTLTDMVIFISFLFYGLVTFGVFILRRKLPSAPRPYKVIGYPFVPAIFVVCTLFFLVVTLYNDISNYILGKTEIINSVFGIVLIAIGIPLFWYFQRKKKTDQLTS